MITKRYDFESWVEYQAIKRYYGDRCAKRSGVPYINHINEGLSAIHYVFLLRNNEDAMRAFCIHPLVQLDEDLKINYDDLISMRSCSSPKILALAFEYRNIANSALAKHNIESKDQITLSPLEDVNIMLIGDKMQNYKDLELYHRQTHPNFNALAVYFDCWLEKLGVRLSTYDMWSRFIAPFPGEWGWPLQ